MSQTTDPTAGITVDGVVPGPRSGTDPTAVRAIKIDMPEESLVDLRRRLAATRLPKQTAGRRSGTGGAAGHDPGAYPLLVH